MNVDTSLEQSLSVALGTENEDECKEVIEQIRREEFGIGLELGEEESKLVQRQREREGRGLHRLSTELYSRDTHFVLELVQNADDNSYPENISDTGYPSLVFVLERDKIVVLNNEVGFMENNIRALCDVGRSTKGAHRYGYIGVLIFYLKGKIPKLKFILKIHSSKEKFFFFDMFNNPQFVKLTALLVSQTRKMPLIFFVKLNAI